MIATDEKAQSAPPPIAVVDIGNSSVGVGLWSNSNVSKSRSFPTNKPQQVRDYLIAMATELVAKQEFLGVAIASVVPDSLESLSGWIEESMKVEPLIVGRQLPYPLTVDFADADSVGADRLCSAAAAFDRLHTGCVVVDCGSAITVDLVDDEGIFIGGAILPGLRMQARALHDHTALILEISPAKPNDIVATTTTDAVRAGVFHGSCGAIRGMVEAYATRLNRWPTVVGTGGDIELIAPDCDVIEKLVPDLCLIGVGIAHDRRLEQAVFL